MSGTWVYFCSVNDRLIKVGRSSAARGQRLRQHSASSVDGHAAELTLLVEVHAESPSAEGSVKRYFKRFRTNHSAEVFHPKEPLVDYVRWLREQPFVSDPADSDDLRRAMPIVESSLWLPSKKRITPKRGHDLLVGMYPPFDLPPRIFTPDDFFTNEKHVEAAREAMGGIDLDPASNAYANQKVMAKRIFTIYSDGLAQMWEGNVWLNPPFNKWTEWAPKVLKELDRGGVDQMCVLAATRTLTTRNFHTLLERSRALFVTRGRLAFWGHNAGSPDDGHAILYFGERHIRFAKAFGELGTVFFSTKELEHDSNEEDEDSAAQARDSEGRAGQVDGDVPSHQRRR